MTESGHQIDEQAADWAIRMESDVWSAADEVALQTWLERDPRHAGALLEAQALWAAFDADEPATGAEDGRLEDVLAPQAFAIGRRTLIAGGAALAASIAGGVMLLREPRYTTGVGEIRRILLADGSVAAVNTDSAVEVAIAATRRDVKLDRGEAWFQVAKDPARPFIVAAGRVRVQAVGTAFSVRHHGLGADVLVTEGIVEVWADGTGGRPMRLTAGQSAFVADKVAVRTADTGSAAIDRTLAWRVGKIALAGMPLDDAATEFNRYNQRRIEVIDPAIAAEKFDGVFGVNDPETFAKAVRDGLQVPIDLSDPMTIRIGRAPA